LVTTDYHDPKNWRLTTIMSVLTDTANQGSACPCCGSRQTNYQRQMRGWQISECQLCGCAFSEIVPTPEDISEIYERIYEAGGLFEQNRKEVNHIQDDLARAVGKSGVGEKTLL